MSEPEEPAGERFTPPPAVGVERIISEAIARGEFDDLPGAGKPLDLSDAGDPDWWVKRMLKREQLDTSATLPPVIQLRREFEELPAELATLTSEDGVRRVLADYNRRVKEDRLRSYGFNLPIPIVAPLADIEEMVEQWRRARPVKLASEAAVEPPSMAPKRRWWRRGHPQP